MSLEPPSLCPSVPIMSSPILRASSPSVSLSVMSVTSTSTAFRLGASTPQSSRHSSGNTSPPSDASRPRSPIEATSTELETSVISNPIADVDPQIVEALKSKDRLYVLKLGEQMESLIKERRTRIELSPSTSYQRLLVHRCSAYYRLVPESDSATKTISVLYSVDSRIPARRLAELVPAESNNQPAFKIMRRTPSDRMRPKPRSQGGSVAGEDADLSDIEPSEAGSLGGRSSATNSGKNRIIMTIAEREAAYQEARSRIFMDFEEKEKEKEKDMSASSSSLSLASGSASTSGGGGGSSVGDIDESVGSPATESEWSGPVTRDRKEVARRGGHNSGPSSQRSLRSNAPSFKANGSTSSSRESRAPSPSLQFPSVYESPSSVPSPYEASPMPGHPTGSSYVQPYMYSYPPPGQAPQQGYIAPYPYYVPYPFQPPPMQNVAPPPDPVNSGNGDPYAAHLPPHMAYNPYVWGHPPIPQMSQAGQAPSHAAPGIGAQSVPPQGIPQPYPPSQFIAPGYTPYPIPGYYAPPVGPPPGQPSMPLSPSHAPSYIGEMPQGGNSRDENNSASSSPTFNRVAPSSRNNTLPSGGAVNGNRRGAPQARAAWSYGPGVGMGHYAGGGRGDIVGPRLSGNLRRMSGTSSAGSGSTGNRTPAGDEASSTASSSTSSSSRHTYTSTTSSQHPLPARPDWAVGLKPQPTLHPPHNRHHDNSLSSSRNMSPARTNQQLQLGNASQQPQTMPPIFFQPADFPPLTNISSNTEKRGPVAGGVWTNTSSTRPVLMPSPGHVNTYSSALLQHAAAPANSNNNNLRVDDNDRGFERPPLKGNKELFNPKGSNPRSPNLTQNGSEKERQDRERARTDDVASAILVDRMATVTLGEQ